MANDASLPCRRCGAALVYVPGEQATLTCRYCGEVHPIAYARAAQPSAASSYEELLASQSVGDEHVPVQAMSCGACGAETTHPSNVLSGRCPFCGGPVTSRDAQQRAPDGVLPFWLDESRARAEVTAWQKALWWKPLSLFSGAEASLTAFHPVYLPYWSFDWDVTTDWVMKLKQESRGSVRTRVDGMTVLASSTFPVEIGANLEPWDLENVAAPRAELTLGVWSETHDARTGLARSAALSHRLLEHDIDQGIDGGRVTKSLTHHYHAIRFRLLLLPVWSTSYRHEGKLYRVLVNARTGEVSGERPVSVPKVLLSCVAPFVLPSLVGVVSLVAALSTGGDATSFLVGFWATLGAQSLLLLMRPAAKGPVRQGQFSLRHPGRAGTENFAEIVGGALQNDRRSRAELIRGVATICFIISIPPFGTTLGYQAERLPVAMVVMFHAFSVIVLLAMAYAVVDSRRKKRFLLGQDDTAPR